jgi:hypothetical protein
MLEFIQLGLTFVQLKIKVNDMLKELSEEHYPVFLPSTRMSGSSLTCGYVKPLSLIR